MFRAGMLSTLEEIREGALTKIIVKMQCQARRVLVHVTYQGKIAEKKGISSIQRNIRLYYNCRVSARLSWTISQLQEGHLLHPEEHPSLLQLQSKCQAEVDNIRSN